MLLTDCRRHRHKRRKTAHRPHRHLKTPQTPGVCSVSPARYVAAAAVHPPYALHTHTHTHTTFLYSVPTERSWHLDSPGPLPNPQGGGIHHPTQPRHCAGLPATKQGSPHPHVLASSGRCESITRETRGQKRNVVIKKNQVKIKKNGNQTRGVQGGWV